MDGKAIQAVVVANPGKALGPPRKKLKSPAQRATWTTVNVEALLILRSSEAVKNKYHSTKTKSRNLLSGSGLLPDSMRRSADRLSILSKSSDDCGGCRMACFAKS